MNFLPPQDVYVIGDYCSGIKVKQILCIMKTKDTSVAKVETVKDEIVVDSADVRNAEELALKRGKARIEESEIISDGEARCSCKSGKRHRDR